MTCVTMRWLSIWKCCTPDNVNVSLSSKVCRSTLNPLQLASRLYVRAFISRWSVRWCNSNDFYYIVINEISNCVVVVTSIATTTSRQNCLYILCSSRGAAIIVLLLLPLRVVQSKFHCFLSLLLCIISFQSAFVRIWWMIITYLNYAVHNNESSCVSLLQSLMKQ